MNEWDELVSKQTVIDEINKWLNNFLEDRRDLSDVIKQLPPVKSKIIRCKECKYYKYGICIKICANKSFYGFCDWADK